VPYAREEEMYPLVCAWLESFLRGKHHGFTIHVFDASRKTLSRLIEETGLIANLPAEWPSWDVHVDIVGFAISKRRTDLAFVECKNMPITLGHLSQLLGYSMVARPRYSFIVSPQGPSGSLKSLLITFRRLDILTYYQHRGRLPRSLVIARWNETARTLDYGSLITGDTNYLGDLAWLAVVVP